MSNLPSTEQPKDVQRAQTILSLASNLKEFFIPAITSDSKWNLEFGYIQDFTDIKKNKIIFVKECSLGSLLPLVTNRKKIEKLVNVYQNPNIPGFVQSRFCGQGYRIHSSLKQTEK